MRSTPREPLWWPARSVAAAAVLAVVTVAGLAACSNSSHPAAPPSSQPPLGFRSAPSFLPTATEPVDRVVTATPAHPQLAVQGVGVEVDLASGHGLVTVTGPKVPPFSAPPPPAVTATFAVTISQVSGTIPITPADLTITDQLGRSFHPILVAGEKQPPPTLAAGRSLTFHVTAVMPTGEGRIYWSPTRHHPVVGWDFIVEND